MNRRSIFIEEEAVEVGAHGGRGGRVHVGLSGGADDTFLRKSPETADVRESPQNNGRTDDAIAMWPCFPIFWFI